MKDLHAQSKTIELWPNGAPGAVGNRPEDTPAMGDERACRSVFRQGLTFYEIRLAKRRIAS